MIRSLVLVAGLLLASHIAASAQAMSVQSLMNDGYTIAGIIPGPGVFLQKGNALIVCFVAEKPGSAAVDTQYCKPVK